MPKKFKFPFKFKKNATPKSSEIPVMMPEMPKMPEPPERPKMSEAPEKPIPEMPTLYVPSFSSKHKNIIELVLKYNDIGKNEDNADVKRLFYLQQINELTKFSTDKEIIQWRNKSGNNRLKSHLEHYKVHLDASPLLQSIEFAKAVCDFAPPPDFASIRPEETEFYAAMQKREALFTNGQENIGEYIKCNRAMAVHSEQDPQLQEKALRNERFLNLINKKVAAIQGFFHEEFGEYQTKILGNPDGNNKNFILTIDGEPVPLVIRVEGRQTIGKEQQLQRHAVSKYFSEDYVMSMVPFLTDNNRIAYQPVVFSELASKGDLDNYSKKLKGRDSKEITEQALHFMGMMGDFCTELMKSGHYHPDIKLSNFLTDGERLIVSDRKTLIDEPNPLAFNVLTTLGYAAPEFVECLNPDLVSVSKQGMNTKLDMPSYMSYQVGMALKEFMLNSHLIPSNGKQDFDNKILEWHSLSQFAEPQPASWEVQNMSVLAQELTRENPADRLSMAHYEELLKQVRLAPEEFIANLEKLSPESRLSSYKNMELIRTGLTNLDDDLYKALNEVTDDSPFAQIFMNLYPFV